MESEVCVNRSCLCFLPTIGGHEESMIMGNFTQKMKAWLVCKMSWPLDVMIAYFTLQFVKDNCIFPANNCDMTFNQNKTS